MHGMAELASTMDEQMIPGIGTKKSILVPAPGLRIPGS